MSGNDAASVDVKVWWTPTCGYLHFVVNPTCIPWECPEGV